MIKIYILIYEDVVLSAAAAPVDILTGTNDILVTAGKSPVFKVELVSEKSRNVLLNAPAQFDCQRTFADLPPKSSGHETALILVPAMSGEWETILDKNRAAVDWIRQHYLVGTEIASMCTGSYFLAEAGILTGKTCTSHWQAVDDMRLRYPDIDIQGDFVVTDHGGTYTGGGAFSSLNLLLYLVEKFCGHEIGIEISKKFSIHRDHISQAHFSVFRGLNQHKDSVVLKAQSYIESNYHDDISVEQVAAKVNMSKRNLIRRFKQATQCTPLEYVQKVKIEAAKKRLEQTQDSIQSLMYDVGYNDIKTFRDIFKRVTGVTPQMYRNKYSRSLKLR
ncbi:GlxA family transcriptional regulator [Microbulbifer epialgicus]|uniref:GlxA family transcriptional regulator n=1 Tax=Microbulbifer epialgicus TaxID=393907 RepID=A0ABV4P3N5_9GAMM